MIANHSVYNPNSQPETTANVVADITKRVLNIPEATRRAGEIVVNLSLPSYFERESIALKTVDLDGLTKVTSINENVYYTGVGATTTPLINIIMTDSSYGWTEGERTATAPGSNTSKINIEYSGVEADTFWLNSAFPILYGVHSTYKASQVFAIENSVDSNAKNIVANMSNNLGVVVDNSTSLPTVPVDTIA
jgi:hypothetical protein